MLYIYSWQTEIIIGDMCVFDLEADRWQEIFPGSVFTYSA